MSVDVPVGFDSPPAVSVNIPVEFGSPRSDEVAENQAYNPGETEDFPANHLVEPATMSADVPAALESPCVSEATGGKASDFGVTDAADADRPVEPVDLPAVSAGVPTDLGTPHVGELAVQQTRCSNRKRP